MNENFTNEWEKAKIFYLKIKCILTQMLKFETELKCFKRILFPSVQQIS